ncbi:unnamed protein product [Gongylonema pulchrum]|uniref:Uncharacterized protein n=1 Tax=Gongylonema pulchrum TaxID=637853 RepID=A0A183EXW0_9BILA|nr:unnamed protein product [Gongylonema pulchrum]
MFLSQDLDQCTAKCATIVISGPVHMYKLPAPILLVNTVREFRCRQLFGENPQIRTEFAVFTCNFNYIHFCIGIIQEVADAMNATTSNLGNEQIDDNGDLPEEDPNPTQENSNGDLPEDNKTENSYIWVRFSSFRCALRKWTFVTYTTAHLEADFFITA